eukprot:TRINITY_DN39148_c0_g1_i3.p1 TRINITY_DN39148_c0_g1~~TRINITY_DN39148_c0_g1_i3.p1  ORF type:complete len:386 (+),score=127.88 TRINITY_DN39148_c0_g1_i3:92-1159(+)
MAAGQAAGAGRAAGRLHVIINPRSGQGKAERVWAAVLAALAEAGQQPASEHRTTGPRDATQHAQRLPLEPGDVVAAVGGDGTMNEVVNGLMLRADAAHGRFTLCFVPAGSSNAMAWMAGCRDAQRTAAALLRGATQPLDLFAFHQAGGTRFGFLSVSMAMFADVDIDSEACRWFGSARFPVYTAVKLACCCCMGCLLPDHAKCTYRVRVRWLASDGPAPSVERPPRAPRCQFGEGWREYEGDVQFLQLMSVPYMDPTMHTAPGARMDDGQISLQFMRPVNRVSLALQFDQIEKGQHLKNPQWTCEKAHAVAVDCFAPRDKVCVDGELASRGRGFQVEPMPGFVNIIVGDPPPQKA